ncbi:MAG: hypothetical protein LBV80_07620 [Deltaproteobacteria bacterium]|jgi:hypothetical protein|nr:hypothetical protein [Deltaproteobacteria bacterium]
MQVNGIGHTASIYQSVFATGASRYQTMKQNAVSPQTVTAPALTAQNNSAPVPVVSRSAIFLPTYLGPQVNLDGITFEQVKHVDSSRMPDSKTRTAINSDGTQVSVVQADNNDESGYRLNFGESLSLDFVGDLRLGKNEEGNYLVYSFESNKTTVYNADGSVSAELDGDTTAGTINKVHIGTSGAELQGSDEDELFFVFGDNTKVTCGSGNDTIVLPKDSHGAQINTGEGDNTIIGYHMSDAVIATGDGDNKINASSMINSNLTIGDGNNNFDIDILADTSVYVGNGDNSIESLSMVGGGFIIGNGNNKFNVCDILDANINIGNGDNNINMYQINSDSIFKSGNGNNDVEIKYIGGYNPANSLIQDRMSSIWYMFKINNGSHSSFYQLKKMTESAIQTINEHITKKNKELHTNTDINSVSLGNGNNNLNVWTVNRNSSINLGDGNNDAFIGNMNNSYLEIGNGNNRVNASIINGNSSIMIGGGNNEFFTRIVNDNSNILMGDGENKITITDWFGKERIFSVYPNRSSREEVVETVEQENVPQTELTRRVGMLSSWNSPKFIN